MCALVGLVRVAGAVCLCIAAHRMVNPANAQDRGTWEWMTESAPQGRTGHAIAYDTARHRTVVFGGARASDLSGLKSDTWEWDGTRWELIATDGPSNRVHSQMAYDKGRGVMVLFGGRDATGGVLGDTWEWDGVAWRQVSTSGPPARGYHVLSYDEARAEVVLFGGWDWNQNLMFDDTWTWNGAEWRLAATDGPAPRRRSAMAYDEVRRVTVLFGGRISGSQVENDTWEWDGNEWREIIAEGTTLKMEGHRMVFYPLRGAVMIVCGQYERRQFEFDYNRWLWYWTGVRWVTLSYSQMPAREDAGVVFDLARDELVVMGGHDRSQTYGDVRALRDFAWHRREATVVPSPRVQHAMAYDSVRQLTILFGGEQSYGGGVVGDTWTWDGNEWTLVSTEGPEPRAEHAMAFDTRRGVIVLYGGINGDETVLRDTWEWNGSEWRLVDGGGPAAIHGHEMVYDSGRGVTVMFGGEYQSGILSSSLSEWDGASWLPRETQLVRSRRDHGMAYDVTRGVTVIQGGMSSSGILGATWTWDGDWLAVSNAPPPGLRSGHSMVFDDSLNLVILFGGDLGGPEDRSDTWAWDGRGWGLLTDRSPAGRVGHAMAFDSDRKLTVMFGGQDRFSPRSDTWEYTARFNPVLSGAFICPSGRTGSLWWTDASPNGRYHIIFSSEEGNVLVPAGPCAGTILGLGSRNIRVVHSGRSSNLGEGSLAGEPGRRACGNYLQLLDVEWCTTSNVVRIE